MVQFARRIKGSCSDLRHDLAHRVRALCAGLYFRLGVIFPEPLAEYHLCGAYIFFPLYVLSLVVLLLEIVMGADRFGAYLTSDIYYLCSGQFRKSGE